MKEHRQGVDSRSQLATIGLYGLMAYAVSRRTHEIGIRMALGARPGAVLRSTLLQGGRLIFLGLVLGVILGMDLQPGGRSELCLQG